jgi:hypothetical protein
MHGPSVWRGGSIPSLFGMLPASTLETSSVNYHIHTVFTAQNIKDLMDAKPFKPFRICLPDGKAYEVPNHDAAWVTRDYVEIGTHLDSAGFAENVARCAIIHITRIEEPQAA